MLPEPAAAGAAATRLYDLNAPPMPPQIMLATEDYNRLVRMIQQGAKVKMAREPRDRVLHQGSAGL